MRDAGTFRQMGDYLERFGKWATIYKRFRRWSENGVLLRTLQVIQKEYFAEMVFSVLSLDSIFAKASPSAAGALKKRQTIVRTNQRRNQHKNKRSCRQFDDNRRISSSPCNSGDGPEGRVLLKSLDASPFEDASLLMDRAYEGDETRALAGAKGFKPIVPPKSNRKEPWEYDKELYKRRNEVERFFEEVRTSEESQPVMKNWILPLRQN